MKKVFYTICFIIIGFSAIAQTTEKEAVQQIIQSAYVDGIHNRAGVEKIEAGFHPGFELLGMSNGLLTKYPIYSWITAVQRAMAENKPTTEKITATFPLIDVAGDAAIARVELYRGDKHLFTDYLSLYKFEDGWKIVSKIYYRIPEKE